MFNFNPFKKAEQDAISRRLDDLSKLNKEIKKPIESATTETQVESNVAPKQVENPKQSEINKYRAEIERIRGIMATLNKSLQEYQELESMRETQRQLSQLRASVKAYKEKIDNLGGNIESNKIDEGETTFY